MKKNSEAQLQEEELQDPADSPASVDDFLRQLEAKEKDLHITADLSIEIEESEFEFDVPESISADLEQAQKAIVAEPSSKPTDQRLKSEIAALKNQVAQLKAERLKLVDNNKIRTREFDNFKNRMERERRQTFVNQVSNLAIAMLPVLDNLERAIESAADLKEEKSEEFDHFFEGIVIVNHQIIDVLARMGVVPISSVGEDFDPNFHEAVAIEPSEGLDENTISAELVRGYRIGEKILRHSMVKVVGGASATEIDEPQDPKHLGEVEPPKAHQPLPAHDEDVEEFIASSYANGEVEEPEEK